MTDDVTIDPTIGMMVMEPETPYGQNTVHWRTASGDLVRITASNEPVLDHEGKPTGRTLLRIRLRQLDTA